MNVRQNDILMDALEAYADFEQAKRASSAIQILSTNPPPAAVLLADGAVTYPEFTFVAEVVLNYVRQGGAAMFLGDLGDLDKSNPFFGTNVTNFFARAGLDWQVRFNNERLLPTRLCHGIGSRHPSANMMREYRTMSRLTVFSNQAEGAEVWWRLVRDNGLAEAVSAIAAVGRGRLGFHGESFASREGHCNAASAYTIMAWCGIQLTYYPPGRR